MARKNAILEYDHFKDSRNSVPHPGGGGRQSCDFARGAKPLKKRHLTLNQTTGEYAPSGQ